MTTDLIPGTHNARDLGGIETEDGRVVRKGRIFRCDALTNLPVAGTFALVQDLGARCLIDLRGQQERIHSPVPSLPGAVAVHHLPLWDGNRSDTDQAMLAIPLADKYRLLAQFAAPRIGTVLRTIVEAQAPTVFFCTFGKDRTGLIAAVLLSGLGVPAASVVADYTRTEAAMKHLLSQTAALAGIQPLLDHLPPADLHAEPATMTAFLSGMLEAYGSWSAYLTEAGLDADWQAAARDSLLETRR